MAKTIFTGPIIFTNARENPVIESGAVFINDSVILEVGAANKIRRLHPDVAVKDLGDGLLTPGLVNIHHHLYSSLARGWNPGGTPPANFPEILDKIWWKLDKALQPEDIYYSAIIGLSESVKSGVTAIIDHHAGYGSITGSLDMIADAFKLTGVKGSLCFELSDRAGKDAFESGLKETIGALKNWIDLNNGGQLAAMIGLHASMTLSNESLNRIIEMAGNFKSGYHFHLAEDKSDQEDCLAKHKMRIVERFAKYGLLGAKSLAVHGVHLSEDEIKQLADTKTNLALCARSNQNNAVGFPEWWRYKGIKIGLGTDGIGSDIIQEAKSALYISRHEHKDPDFGFSLLGELLLNNNPEIFQNVTGHRVGKIAAGYPADMVLWRYNSPTPINSENIWGHFLYGLSDRQADSVWVNGEQVLSKGDFCNLDYDKMFAEARIIAEKLWKRI